MEILIKRLEATQKALKKLDKNLKNLENKTKPTIAEHYEEFRNSAIQTFEFSTDTFWKLIKDYLDYKHGIILIAPSPRAIFKEAFKLNIIKENEIEILYAMVADRNVPSHTYNEDLA